MQQPRRRSSEEQRHSESTRVEDAVKTILRKLKRGQPVRLPGIGSLLPGAPPQFRSIDHDKPAPSARKDKSRNAKR